MRHQLAILASVVLAGCATQSKPDFQLVTNFTPDCQNEAAQIRFLNKMKRFESQGDVSDRKFDTTIDIQIERLKFYCHDQD
jgi:outer membrane biogenesis lipoprotein LolB